jgi:hypothetical protein
VWEDHLLPLLTSKDAARLGCTCNALKEVVREHFKDLGNVKADQLKAALTSFPKARTLGLNEFPGIVDWLGAQKDALFQWLGEEGRCKALERVDAPIQNDGPDHRVNACAWLVHMALAEGAFPSLKNLTALLMYEGQRASLRSIELVKHTTDLQVHHNLKSNGWSITSPQSLRSRRWAWCGSCLR